MWCNWLFIVSGNGNIHATSGFKTRWLCTQATNVIFFIIIIVHIILKASCKSQFQHKCSKLSKFMNRFIMT